MNNVSMSTWVGNAKSLEVEFLFSGATRVLRSLRGCLKKN